MEIKDKYLKWKKKNPDFVWLLCSASKKNPNSFPLVAFSTFDQGRQCSLHSPRQHAVRHHWNFNFKRWNHLFSSCSKRCRRPRLHVCCYFPTLILVHTVKAYTERIYGGIEYNSQAKISHFRLHALRTEWWIGKCTTSTSWCGCCCD